MERLKLHKNRIFMVCVAFLTMLCLLAPTVRTNGADSGLRPKAAELPEGTIIIGVYIIDMSALTEEIQSMAEKSAEGGPSRSPQQKLYYKSDINKGTWYDITNAKDINDISKSTNNIVKNAVIDGLALEFYVKPDGTIISFAMGGNVSAHDIEQKTDPSNMSELDAIKSEKSVLEGLASALNEKDLDEDDEDDAEDISLLDAYNKEIDSINALLTGIKDGRVPGLINDLNKMDASIKKLDSAESIDLASSLKIEKRNELDIICYEEMINRLDNEMKVLGEIDRLKHSDLIGAYGDAVSAITQKLDELRDKQQGDDNSLLGKEELKVKEEMSEALISGDDKAVDEAVTKALAVEALIDGTIGDSTAVGELLNGMLKSAIERLVSSVNQIVKEKVPYYTENDTGSKDSELEGISAIISDISNLIEDIYARDKDDANKQELLDEFTATVNELIKKLREDIQTGDGSSQDALKTGLIALLEGAANDSGKEAALTDAQNDKSVKATKESIDKLKNQAENLNDSYLDALEKGDADGAENLKTQEDEVLNKLDRLFDDSKEKYNKSLTTELKSESNILKAKEGTDTGKERSKKNTAAAEADTYASMMSDVDSGLINKLNEARSSFSDAVKETDVSDIANAYEAVVEAVENLDNETLYPDNKAAILANMQIRLADALDVAEDSGNSRLKNVLSDVNDNLKNDIAEAKKGNMKKEPEGNLSDIIIPEHEGEISQSEADLFSQYDVVCSEYEVYLKDNRYLKNDVYYIPAIKLAELMGAQVLYSGNIVIIKDNMLQLECEEGSERAFINDKLRLLDNLPEITDGFLYIPVDLFAEIYGMEVVIYEDTVILY